MGYLVSIRQLHDELCCHVEKWERTGDLFLLEKGPFRRFIAIDLEVNKEHTTFHLVDLYIHSHRNDLRFSVAIPGNIELFDSFAQSGGARVLAKRW